MKLILLICSMVFAYIFTTAQDGGLDNTFDTDGIVTTAIGVEGDFSSDIAVQEDGKILLVGTSDIGTNENPLSVLTLVRYNTDGALDNSFSGDGIATFDLGGGVWGRSVAILPDGKVLAAGTHGGATTQDFLIVKFNSDGTVDMTFGTNGRVETDFASSNDICKKIHITPDGKIVLTGLVVSTAGDRDFGAARYNADGTLDVTFGGDGKVTFDLVNDDDRFYHSALQSDGKLILFGEVEVVNDHDFAILRCNVDGSLDNSFGTNGIVITDFGTTRDFGYSVLLQPDGKIIGSGQTDLFSASKLGMVRYNTDGTLDNTFGTGGTVSITIVGGVYERSGHAIVQSDGKIVITGTLINADGGDIILVRLSADGVLDNAFGNNGIVTTDIGENSNASSGIILQSDSKILIGGNAFPDDNGNGIFTLSRYLSGLELGVLDFSIVNNGILIYPNPIQESAVIEYTLTNNETISIDLYNISGKLMQSFLKSEERNKGVHKETLVFDTSIPSGNYILTLSNGVGSSSVRVVK